MKLSGFKLMSGVIDWAVRVTDGFKHSPSAFKNAIHRAAKWVDNHESEMRRVLHHVAFFLLVSAAILYMLDKLEEKALNHAIVAAGIILNL